MAEHLNLYIMGRWRPEGKGAPHELRCPADGRLVAMGADGSTEDMHAAIPAAREAFDTGLWPERERADVLRRTADLIDRDRKDFSRAEALDTGKRTIEAENDMNDVVACPRYYAGVGGTEAGHVVDIDKVDAISGPVHEPVGVCGLITPWTYPLFQAIWKVAPALLAGNTVVLTPSELTPSTAALLMRALEEAGLPAGVANLVLGAGPRAGAPLSEHPDVDMVSFTGGAPSGTRVMVAAAPTVKRVALEFGGKSPNGVFADADFETAVDSALTAVFLHSGQVFGRRPAHRRAVIARSVRRRGCRTRRADRARRTIRPGRRDRPTDLGRPRDKVETYVDAGLADGLFYPSTVLDGCHSDISAAHEESFDPVLTVETFTHEDEAARLGNDTVYGLAGAVWPEDAGKAQRVASRLGAEPSASTTTTPYLPQAEWGGMKRSGNGRELGRVGLDEYREIKHIWQNPNPQPERWFRQ